MNIAIAITIMVMYIIVLCIANRQIPASLSEAVYNLPSLGSWLWVLVILAVAFLTMPTLIELASENTKFLGFLSCVALAFVAVCPLDPKQRTHKAHMIASYAAAILSQLLVAFNNPWLLLMWIPWVAAFIWITKDEKWRTAAFWATITCFVTTFTFYLI